MLGHADHEAVVEQREGLQRGDGFVAAFDDQRRVGAVERREERIGGGADDEAVDGAAADMAVPP